MPTDPPTCCNQPMEFMPSAPANWDSLELLPGCYSHVMESPAVPACWYCNECGEEIEIEEPGDED